MYKSYGKESGFVDFHKKMYWIRDSVVWSSLESQVNVQINLSPATDELRDAFPG